MKKKEKKQETKSHFKQRKKQRQQKISNCDLFFLQFSCDVNIDSIDVLCVVKL